MSIQPKTDYAESQSSDSDMCFVQKFDLFNRMMKSQNNDVIGQVNDFLCSVDQIESQIQEQTIAISSYDPDEADGNESKALATRVFPNVYTSGSKWKYPPSVGYVHDEKLLPILTQQSLVNDKISYKSPIPLHSPLYDSIRQSFSNPKSNAIKISPQMIDMLSERSHVQVPFFNHAKQTYSTVNLYLFTEEHFDYCIDKTGLSAEDDHTHEMVVRDKYDVKRHAIFIDKEENKGVYVIPTNLKPHYRSTKHPLYPGGSSEESKRKLEAKLERKDSTVFDMTSFKDSFRGYCERQAEKMLESSSTMFETETSEGEVLQENELEIILGVDPPSTSRKIKHSKKNMLKHAKKQTLLKAIEAQTETPKLPKIILKRDFVDDDGDEKPLLMSEPGSSSSTKASRKKPKYSIIS